MRHGLKIAFTGAGGTGKTTTVNDFYHQTSSDTLKELGSPIKLKSASRSVYVAEQLTEDLVLEMTPAEKWELQTRIFNKKIKLDDSTRSFVADRTLLDHWAYCLMYCATTITEDEYHRTESLVRKHMLATYSHIFYFPWGFWKAPPDGVRQDNPAWQSAIDALILGYLVKWNIPAVAVPQDKGELARVDFVIDQIIGEK